MEARMRRLSVIGIWAAGAFALTLAVFQPLRLNATDPAVKPDVSDPHLVANKVELRLQYIDKQPPAQSKPDNSDAALSKSGLVPFGAEYSRSPRVPIDAPIEFNLLAKNTSDQPADVNVTVSVQFAQKASPLSRTMPKYKQIWSEQQVVTLSPGETRIIPMTPDFTFGDFGMANIQLTCGKQTIAPISLMVIKPIDIQQTASATQ
jgi:hypothetical protein